MDVVVERCAGLDVHKDTVVAALRTPAAGGGRDTEVRSFETFTAELLALRDWLVERQVSLVDSGHEKLPGDGHETARWRT